MANIVITGASRGIGFELAKLFADGGHKVLAISRNVAPIAQLGHKNIECIPIDITASEDLKKLMEVLAARWKHIDILINNAGKLVNKPFLETTTFDFEAVYRVNVFGLVNITQAVIPRMTKNGHVVSISSMGGVQGSLKFPGLSAYSSSKGAVITLTELWAEEFKSTGPSFNVLAIGAVQTEMLAEAFPGYLAPVTARQMAAYIRDFSLTGNNFYNGKVLQVSSTTP